MDMDMDIVHANGACRNDTIKIQAWLRLGFLLSGAGGA
jgi:hypothetical protein